MFGISEKLWFFLYRIISKRCILWQNMTNAIMFQNIYLFEFMMYSFLIYKRQLHVILRSANKMGRIFAHQATKSFKLINHVRYNKLKVLFIHITQ